MCPHGIINNPSLTCCFLNMQSLSSLNITMWTRTWVLQIEGGYSADQTMRAHSLVLGLSVLGVYIPCVCFCLMVGPSTRSSPKSQQILWVYISESCVPYGPFSAFWHSGYSLGLGTEEAGRSVFDLSVSARPPALKQPQRADVTVMIVM